jgi:glycosyltransferase involved in cell wall biosynthesis
LEISVVIPVYNAAEYLEKAVESALQFDEVKEILLIEDGSPDNSIEICRKLESQHNHIKVFQHSDKKNHGASASRNLGIKNAQSEFIAFLDADDFYLKNRFEKDKILLKEYKDIDAVYNGVGVHYYSDEFKDDFITGQNDEFITVKEHVAASDLFKGLIKFSESIGYIHLDGFTVKKKFLDEMNPLFISDLRVHQDTEFFIRLSYYGKFIGGELKVPVAKRGIHKNNRIIANNLNKEKRILNQYKLFKWLVSWAYEEKVENKILLHLKMLFWSRKMLVVPYLKRWFLFLNKGFKEPDFIIKARYYDYYHPGLFGDGWLGKLLLRVKYKLHRVFNVEWKS